jgi:Xaa-Pro aminopeptidase
MAAHKKFKKQARPALLLLALWTVIPLLSAAKTQNVFASRRDLVRIFMKGRALVHSGLPEIAFDKNFYYLAGVREPDALLLVAPQGGNDVLFVKSIPDAQRLRSMVKASGISLILSSADFDRIFGNMMMWGWALYVPKIYNYSYYFILDLVKNYPYLKIRDLSPLLFRMRTAKSAEEIEIITRASEITAAGLSAAMRAAAPGMYEYELQDIIESVFFVQGAERTSFASIIGSGPNSVIIHYFENTRKIEPGDLVVMDVGAEYLEYAGDVTRTIPISGRFTARQREIYEIVLEAQSRAIAACRPGATGSDVDLAARNYIKDKGYDQYFTHYTTHSLGLDVHDPWLSWRLLPGMIITIEPGIYIPEENVGVRIEDDVLITESGPVVLSVGVPKKIEDIEHLMAERIRNQF